MKDYYNDPKYKEFQDIIKQEEQKMNSINNSIKIELLCELAHKRVLEECINDSNSRYIKENTGEGQYTDEGQDLFNEWYDYYDSIILSYLKEIK